MVQLSIYFMDKGEKLIALQKEIDLDTVAIIIISTMGVNRTA